MAYISGILSEGVGFLPRLFDIILKQIYKEEGIKSRIVVDLTSRKRTVNIHLSANRQIKIDLRIANYTPFELIAENITLKFILNGNAKKVTKNDFHKITNCSEEKIFLSENLSLEDAKEIAEMHDPENNCVNIAYTIDFSNRLYRFQKQGVLNDFFIDVTGLPKNFASIPETRKSKIENLKSASLTSSHSGAR